MQNNVCSDLFWYEDMFLIVWTTPPPKQNNNNKSIDILYTNYMRKGETMTSSTHSFEYSYRLFKKCFVEKKLQKFKITFLIFYPIYINFSLFCSKSFSLSMELL